VTVSEDRLPEYRPPAKVHLPQRRRVFSIATIDQLLVVVSTVAVGLLAVVLFRQGLSISWSVLYLVLFWAVLAYLALPRVHRLLSTIYVPEYFIGRTHTPDGLLGDPVNLAVRGRAEQVHATMQRAGWTLADPITLRTAWRIVLGSLARRSYPEAPVSALLLFGTVQAFAYQQEVAGNPSQRHHIRFWPTPEGWLLPGGHRVDFLAAGTYDRAVGLSLFTLQITHKIDADIDAERDYVIDTVRCSSEEVTTTVLENFSTGYHSRNGGGDAVVTDGNMPILELASVPVTAELMLPRVVEHGLQARPPALVAAIACVGLGMLVDLGTYLPGVVRNLKDVLQGADTATAVVVSGIVAGIFLVSYAIQALFLWRTAKGWGGSRLVVLALLCGQVMNQLVTWITLPHGALPALAVLATALFVLAVYALTTPSVATWTTAANRRARSRRSATV
jgi:hypothetical protein